MRWRKLQDVITVRTEIYVGSIRVLKDVVTAGWRDILSDDAVKKMRELWKKMSAGTLRKTSKAGKAGKDKNGRENGQNSSKKVIDLRNRNILVSAAAGSGKTAVLVERIIQKITDEQSPVDVDRLLIVTFTEAAAAEMKDRIREAIEKKLEENPGNVHLERQATLVHSAPITTIHSFLSVCDKGTFSCDRS